MMLATLIVFCLSSTGPEPDFAKELSASSSASIARVQVDASQTTERGLQIVTVRLKIEPTRQIYGSAALGEEPLYGGLKLALKTRDPKTRIDVLYPKGNLVKHGDMSYRVLDGEVAIQAVVQRAAGDNSPIDGRLDFCAVAQFW